MSELNGVLPIDKPEGPTSHDAVAMARRALGMRRIGHTGTLDPFASGLLLLCLGPSTRLAEYLTALPKRYTATLRLGVTTDTDDRMGEPLHSSEAWRELSREAVEAALRAQVGEILQQPPTYSAKKVEGERMYAAARRGKALEREPVAVTIHSIHLLRYAPPEVDVEVECGSGTYIRAIARDVGADLGVGAHLTQLRRTRIGDHDVEDALTLEQLEDGAAVSAALLTPAMALGHLATAHVTPEEVSLLLNGRAVSAPPATPAGLPVALLTDAGDLVAVGERDGATIRPRKVFS
jgi:tRNA pseudouridine55 synthase